MAGGNTLIASVYLHTAEQDIHKTTELSNSELPFWPPGGELSCFVLS